MAKKADKAPKSAIESVTESDKGIEAMFTGCRLIYNGISEAVENDYEGTITYSFKAGLAIPDGPALQDLIARIKKHFKAKKLTGWSSDIALEHFDEKKFMPASQEGFVLLYPTAPAEKVEGGFRAKGRLYVNPSHDIFYAGCYVDAKVAFVANKKGAITIKDYLNGIRFVADGEPISGPTDPWGGSSSRSVVSKVKAIEEKPASKPAKKKR